MQNLVVSQKNILTSWCPWVCRCLALTDYVSSCRVVKTNVMCIINKCVFYLLLIATLKSQVQTTGQKSRQDSECVCYWLRSILPFEKPTLLVIKQFNDFLSCSLGWGKGFGQCTCLKALDLTIQHCKKPKKQPQKPSQLHQTEGYI